MIKDFLQSISDSRLFAIIFLLLVLVAFVIMLIYVFRMKKKDVKRYSHLPLDDSEPPETDRIPADHKENKSGK